MSRVSHHQTRLSKHLQNKTFFMRCVDFISMQYAYVVEQLARCYASCFYELVAFQVEIFRGDSIYCEVYIYILFYLNSM